MWVILILICFSVAAIYFLLGIWELCKLVFNLIFRLDKTWRKVVMKSKDYKEWEKKVDELLK